MREKIRVTGNKLDDKIYYHHTGYIGGIKSIALEQAARRSIPSAPSSSP